MAKKKSGYGWVGGYVLGFISVALIFFVVWQISGRDSKKQATTAPAASSSPSQSAVAPPDDHDHAALEAAIAKTPRITPEELKELVDRNEVVIIDVRSANDYMEAHLPEALQIPLSFVEGEIPYFPRDKKIVTYCSCPAEETSGHAALILQNGGLTNVAALVGGIDTWRARGYPIETGMPEPAAPQTN